VHRSLIEAERSIDHEGDDFIHMDVRSDNICFVDDRVVFVDWNWAVRGPRDLDLAAWLPSLRLEGGPLPEEVAPGHGNHAAALSGFFASRAPEPAPPTAPYVRRFQLRQLRISLPWACRELGLLQPDVRWAQDEIDIADADLEAGRITEARWHERVEEPLIDAYLSVDDQRAQSGKGGDEATWKWSRELILDVFPPNATFLDVGCANGYLMESVQRWGSERGIDVEPYGLDISSRIVALARNRLPQWQDRIFVGNAMDWEPPRRFDLVQIGIDEVSVPRRRELVERVLRTFVVPGGLLVFRAGRVGDPNYATPDEQLHELGLRPDGIIERAHPETGELRRTAWMRAPVR
jgi:SAM-dependent methyltransferase